MTMKKLRILVDLDGIVANTLPYWLKRIAHKTKVVAQIEDIRQWDLHKCPPLDTVDPKIIFGLLNEDGFMENIPIFFGAAEGLQQLIADGHEIYLVTARTGLTSMPETLRWVKKNLPFINVEKQLIFCYNKELIEADVIIDDKPDTLIRYMSTHSHALALGIRYPYNEPMPEKIAQLFGPADYLNHTLTWGQIVGYIKAYSLQENY